jgi:hypothetical protein
MTRTVTDALGVEILPTDTVLVTSWGTARLVDTGTRSPVVRFGRTRVVILDADREERAVSPSEVSVVRRDGEKGLEGNLPAYRAAALARLAG